MAEAKTKETVLHENSKGVQIIRTDYVKRSCVSVRSNGYTLMKYRMNNIPFYEHQYLSWDNLDCCNGWTYDEEYLFTAVQKNKKLVADITISTDINSYATANSIFHEKISKINPDKEEIWSNQTPIENYTGYWWDYMIIKKGCLSDYYDIEEIINAYKQQDCILDKDSLLEYSQISLYDLFANHINDFDYGNPRDDIELVIDGLGLGYPIESTASLLNGY